MQFRDWTCLGNPKVFNSIFYYKIANNMIFKKNSFFRNKDNKTLIISTLMTIGSGSIFYHFIENWNWIDSIYFSVITLTTVGYGDFSPQTDLGKVFTIFYIIIGIGLMFAFINSFFEHRLKNKKANA